MRPKKYVSLFVLLMALALFTGKDAHAQNNPPPPDCVILLNNFTGAGSTSTFPNYFTACQSWTFQYTSVGFTGLTITIQSAPASTPTTPGAWVTYAGTTVTGSNPNTSTTGAVSTFKNGTVDIPFVRVTLSGLTGSGTVFGVLYGYKTGYMGGSGINSTCPQSTLGQLQTYLSPQTCGAAATLVASLPTASSNTNAAFEVSDGASPSDCTAGGGTTRVLCASDGSAWVSLGSSASTPPPTPSQPNQTISGCGVEYTSALNITVGACTYIIAGVTYTSPLTNLTFSVADPTNPRIDAVVVDNTGIAAILPGTPAVTPVDPTIDVSTHLDLTFMLIPAMGTAPSGVVSTVMYDENTEWTCTPTANINCASTNNPYHGTKDIEATSAVLNNNFTLVKPAAGTVDLSTQNNLTFYIRSKATWPTGKNGANAARFLSIYWLNGATQVGNQIVLRDGVFGFSSSNTTTYQQINIPVGLFQTGSNLVTTLKVIVSGNTGSSTIGWYVDEVTLQSGFNPPPTSITQMNFRGTWASTTAYNPNDMVVSGGVGYVALIASTNVAVGTTSTWAPLATSGGTTNQNIRTIGASFGSFQSGGTALSSATTACVPTYFTGTIQAVEVVADVSGTATFNVLSVAHGSWTGTASASSLSGGTFTMTTAARYTDTTLSGWTTSVTAGTDFCFAVTSPSTVAGLSITIKVAAN